jgi:hypothetical protein
MKKVKLTAVDVGELREKSEAASAHMLRWGYPIVTHSSVCSLEGVESLLDLGFIDIYRVMPEHEYEPDIQVKALKTIGVAISETGMFVWHQGSTIPTTSELGDSIHHWLYHYAHTVLLSDE